MPRRENGVPQQHRSKRRLGGERRANGRRPGMNESVLWSRANQRTEEQKEAGQRIAWDEWLNIVSRRVPGTEAEAEKAENLT
jgi:hypothetical protein